MVPKSREFFVLVSNIEKIEISVKKNLSPVLAVPFWLFCPGSPVLGVISCLFCPSYSGFAATFLAELVKQLKILTYRAPVQIKQMFSAKFLAE